jgi:hypothetical protein
MSYYWLSFCSSDRPEGDQFLGGCLIEAEDVDDAIKKSRQRGCNPGGEVACLQVHEKYEANIDRFKLNHLYSKQELIDTGEYRTWQDALNSGDIK